MQRNIHQAKIVWRIKASSVGLFSWAVHSHSQGWMKVSMNKCYSIVQGGQTGTREGYPGLEQVLGQPLFPMCNHTLRVLSWGGRGGAS